MKTKLIKLVLIVTVLFLTACNGASDTDKCLQSVKAVFPHSQIYKSPKSSFIFYVVDSTGVKIVTTMKLSDTSIDGIQSLIKIN